MKLDRNALLRRLTIWTLAGGALVAGGQPLAGQWRGDAAAADTDLPGGPLPTPPVYATSPGESSREKPSPGARPIARPDRSRNLAGLSTWRAKSTQQIRNARPAAESVPGQATQQMAAAGDMIGFSHSDGAGSQTITLVNTSKSWIAVYHIDRSGTIRLMSSRPIDADFTLQLNATAPLPSDIRKLGRQETYPSGAGRH